MVIDKANIKERLIQLMSKVRIIKKQLTLLQRTQHEFTFQSIYPKRWDRDRQMQFPQVHRDSNKQNESDKMNYGHATSLPSKQSKISMTFGKQVSNSIGQLSQGSTKTRNVRYDDMKHIKASLFMQLNQIKSLEKREESLRRTNEKIKAYNSEHKMNYRKNQSRGHHCVSIAKLAISEILCAAVGENKSLPSHDSLVSSEISVEIPVSLRPKASTLRCIRGHEYYDGEINSENEPHGNGRLEICCSSISKQIGAHNLRDTQFYQGQFMNGKFHGFGTLSYKGGVKYVGEFRQGKRQGKGSLFFNGKTEIAKWDNDVFVSII